MSIRFSPKLKRLPYYEDRPWLVSRKTSEVGVNQAAA
jgi:hypothetical protein